MKTTTRKQLTVLLAALAFVAPQIGTHFPALQNTPIGGQIAQAQSPSNFKVMQVRDSE